MHRQVVIKKFLCQAIESDSSKYTSEIDDDSYRANERNLDSLKVKGLPPALEEFIPPQYFPDVLLVKDSDQIVIAKSYSALDAGVRSTLAANWIKFNRVLPPPSSLDTDTGKYLRRILPLMAV